MLPSIEAFLAIWDDPVEFVEIHGEHIAGEFKAVIVIAAPDCPELKITLAPMRLGES